ncbi:MAG: hypothetical protein ACRC46_08430 [Thermoguttaceae bacterium]
MIIFYPILVAALFAAELHEVSGRHVRLTTDVDTGAVSELPATFDAAAGAWCEWFRIPPNAIATWQVDACLVGDEKSFAATEILRDVPQLRHGFSIGNRVWLREQPSDYYRAHLLLHEGVHAIMDEARIGNAPPWYREGMAELLATFRRDENGQIVVGEIPRSASEVPMWGRISIITDALAAKQQYSLSDILRMTPSDFDDVKGYAWGWTFCVFLAHHPDHAAFFRRLHETKNARHTQELETHWAKNRTAVERDWATFLDELGYGSDVAACVIDKRNIEKLNDFEIDSAHAWHATGAILKKGTAYNITATGRFSLGDDPSPWWSEPNGITIRYSRGVPIGTLQATVLDDSVTDPSIIAAAFCEPVNIGSRATFVSPVSGRLYFRIADTRGDRANNRGTCSVKLE